MGKGRAGLEDQPKGQDSHGEECERNFTVTEEKKETLFLLKKHNSRNPIHYQVIVGDVGEEEEGGTNEEEEKTTKTAFWEHSFIF